MFFSYIIINFFFIFDESCKINSPVAGDRRYPLGTLNAVIDPDWLRSGIDPSRIATQLKWHVPGPKDPATAGSSRDKFTEVKLLYILHFRKIRYVFSPI